MKQLSKQTTNCQAVTVTVNVIGGKWKPVILFLLETNPVMRFNALFRAIEGISQKMLTQQLRELEDDRLVKRKVYAEVPPRVEYSITPYGKTLQPILQSMHTWGSNHRNKKSN